MTLLEDIQNTAVDGNCDLGTLLRKCKLLAARLGSKLLEDWLIWESNGYPNDVKVPDYRVWPLEFKGNFSGPFGSGLRHAPIYLECIPEKIREAFEFYECRQSVACVEASVGKAKGGSLCVSTGDLALILDDKVYQNQNCIQAWAEFSTGHLNELLNSVRNRILDFALAVGKNDPSAGELGINSSNGIESSLVTQIFNTTVYGGSANLVGTAHDSSIAFNIAERDFASLEYILREKGVPEDDIKELKSALSEEDRVPKQGFGPKVASWIGKMTKKAAEGSWNVGVATAGQLLGQCISKYYGL